MQRLHVASPPSLPTQAPDFNSGAVTARSEPRYRPSLAAGLRLSRGRAVGLQDYGCLVILQLGNACVGDFGVVEAELLQVRQALWLSHCCATPSGTNSDSVAGLCSAGRGEPESRASPHAGGHDNTENSEVESGPHWIVVVLIPVLVVVPETGVLAENLGGGRREVV